MDSIYNAAPGIFEFTRDIASDTRTLVEYMRSQGIIEKEMRCQSGEHMEKRKIFLMENTGDVLFARQKKSIRENTLFKVSTHYSLLCLTIIYVMKFVTEFASASITFKTLLTL